MRPLLGYCDNTGEPLAGMMRRGGAGSNTTADHLQVLGDAIDALPPAFRRRLMVTADGAGASPGLITRLDQLASRAGCQLTYSVGWELGAREHAAIGLVPQNGWQIAVDQHGEVRERRADGACADRSCGHARCWMGEAHVTELTGLLREGPGGDQLDGWPESMRVFARRERPHPGAQLSLFETRDGWRYSLWVSNAAAGLRGWRAQLGYIDAAHRVHARVEDCIRTQKAGIGQFPLARLRDELRVAGRLLDRRGLAVLAAAHRPRRRPGPRRAEDFALPGPACRREAGPRRAAAAAENPRDLALGTGHRHRLGPHHRAATRTLTSQKPSRDTERRNPGARGTPGHRPVSRATVIPRP